MGTDKFTHVSAWDPERKKRENDERRRRLTARQRALILASTMLHGSGGTGAVASIYAAYALADVFTLPQYWVGGTQYGAGEVTTQNNIANSQDLSAASWAKYNGSITANTTVAPDGTTTADTYTPPSAVSAAKGFGRNITQGLGANTISIFVAKGGHRYAELWTDSASEGWRIFDLQAGVISSVGVGSGYMVDHGSYWRIVLVINAINAIDNIYFTYADVLEGAWNPVSTSTTALVAWQGQSISGTFTDGGPQILTTAVAASSGVGRLPGYSFTRSGTQGAVDASGAVQFFAPNVPAINSAGYHAYGALTNILVRSQEFDTTWTQQAGVTVTANQAVAPDGTTTADLIVGDGTTGVFQGGSGASTLRTRSVFLRSVTGTASVLLKDAVATVGTITCNLTTAWQRFVLAETNTGANLWIDDIPAAGIYAWQGQIIDGNFPDGGPIITTTTAAVAIGASDFRQSLAQADADFILFERVNDSNTSPIGGFLEWSAAGAAGNRILYYGSSGSIISNVHSAGALVYSATNAVALTNGVDFTVIITRQGGNWRGGVIHNGTLTWASAATAGAYPVGLDRLDIGTVNAGAFAPPDARIKGPFLKLGTFITDASVIAAVAETA